jgi:hypothetical protein
MHPTELTVQKSNKIIEPKNTQKNKYTKFVRHFPKEVVLTVMKGRKQSSSLKFTRFPRDSGMAPAAKGGKNMVKFRWSVGH